MGLPDRCADVITCCDSLHWMEPGSTFAEIVRVLRPGGVFAWLHFSEPVMTPWEIDQAHRKFWQTSKAADEARAVTGTALRWSKAEYIQCMQTSFRHVCRLQLHQAVHRILGKTSSPWYVSVEVSAGLK